MKRVIITGATGVVGMAITRKCIEKGIEAVLLVNPGSQRLARIPDDPLVHVIKCGLEEFAYATPDSLGFESPDAFIHLSWGGTFGDVRNDKTLQDKNAGYALDAVRLAHRLGCSAFVGAGSQAEYGRVEGVLTPNTPCNPENEYGRAKLRASKETRELCDSFGIRHVWSRILSVYGPYDSEKTMVMSLISSLLKGERLSLTAGEQVWDYLYADDVGEAMLALAEYGADGGIYPIGSGVARPLREYIETIRDLIDPSLPLGFGEVPYHDKQVMHICADISKLCEDTGFVPSVEFAEGASKTIEWFKNYKGL